MMTNVLESSRRSFPKTRWLYLIASPVVVPPSPSHFSVEERRDVTSVLYFAYRRRNADSSFNLTAFQECECHGFLRPRGITFALEIDFVVPVNRYTVYALRPSRLSFPLCPSARVVSCRLTVPSYFRYYLFAGLPVETVICRLLNREDARRCKLSAFRGTM